MKPKILLPTLFVLFISCKKNEVVQTEVESSDQLLTKIVKHAKGNVYTEVVNYGYNDAKKIIAEGDKQYVRDNFQRIIKILDPTTHTNRKEISVYYQDASTGIVDHTICNFQTSDPGISYRFRDSVSYIHDDNNRLIRMLSYISQNESAFFLSHYDIFTYNEKGNLTQFSKFNVNNGIPVNCGTFAFSDYDDKKNPLYSEDEVRLIEMTWDIVNISFNNFSAINNYSRNFLYRSDGRPRSCQVAGPGDAFEITFYYKNNRTYC